MIVTISNLKTTSAAVSGLHSFTEYIIEISAQSSLGVFSDAAIYEVKTDEGGILLYLKLTLCLLYACA